MYRIELREYPIFHVVAHAYWVLYEDGNLIGELHGLATDRHSHHAKTVGTFRDQLCAWRFPAPGQLGQRPSASGGFSGLYSASHASAVVFESADGEATARWRAAQLAAEALNDANVEYRVFGGDRMDITTGNSNGACRTFAEVMGVSMPAIKAWVRPGERKNLLPRDTYAGLYDAGYSVA